MASSSPLKDIEEKFFECSLCLSLFTEPKLLPSCLHRYCRTCLEGYIKDFPDSFKCPLCKCQYDTPEEGADKFKTDFHTQSVVEFIKLQKSLKQEETRSCFGCKEEKKVTAHCFKCKGFLCGQCHQFHLTNDMIAEHRQHILDLKSLDTKSLTLERISSLAVAPRCSVHTENAAQLLCHTCENIPICVACIYGDHEGHAFTEVKKLARRERGDLLKKLSELNQHKEKVFEFPKKVEDAKVHLEVDIATNIQKVETQHDYWCQMVSGKLDRIAESQAAKQASINKRKQEMCHDLQTEMEQEMKKLKTEYEEKMKNAEERFNRESQTLSDKCESVRGRLLAKRAAIDGECESYKEEFTSQGLKNKEKLQGISELFSDTEKRCRNFTATTSAILASSDDWTDAQGIPGITSATEPLIDDVKKDPPSLETFSSIAPRDLPLVLMEDEKTVIDTVEHLGLGSGYSPLDVTCCHNDELVLTGVSKGGNSTFIAIAHVRYGRLHFQKLRSPPDLPSATRLCSTRLSRNKFATACSYGDVGIFDAVDFEMCPRRSIKDILGDGQASAELTAIAADRAGKKIVLCSSGRSGAVIIVNNKLTLLYSLNLPENTETCTGVCVSSGNLVVCDYARAQAYVATMDAPTAQLVNKLEEPALGGEETWRPHRVCVDRHDRIYVLWMAEGCAPGGRTCVVAHYTHDGSQLMGVRRVDKAAYAIATGFVEEEEKLFVCAYSGKIYVFGILS